MCKAQHVRGARAADMLRHVGIPTPERHLAAHPHQLSGGMRQRVMIAMAFVCDAKLLIAEEPTTGLDVTIQAQILKLMKTMRSESGTSTMFITHDLGVVEGMADEVSVMYAGRIVERAWVRSVFKEPRHPYTAGLLESIPSMVEERERLVAIEGVVPSQLDVPPGCAFRPRCLRTTQRCAKESPPLAVVVGPGGSDGAREPADGGHVVACWNPVPPGRTRH